MKKLVKFTSIIALAIIMMFCLIGQASAQQIAPRYFELYNYSRDKNNILGRPTGTYFVNRTSTGGSAYRPLIKIVEATGSNGTQKAQDSKSAVYCVKGGAGFGSSSGNSQVVIDYTQQFDMRNPNGIESPYRSNLPTDMNNYNKLMWVLEHMAIVTDSSSLNSMLSGLDDYSHGGYTLSDFGTFENATVEGANATEVGTDIIEAVQQAAIWHFANNGKDWDPGDSCVFYYSENDNYSGATSLDSLYGDIVDNPAADLYEYLTTGAENAVKNGYTYAKNAQGTITFDKSRATITQRGNNYLVGPYKFTSTSSSVNGFTVNVTGSSSIVKSDGTSYSGSSVTDKIKSSFNNDFYISIPVSETEQNVGISYNYSYNTTSINMLSTDASKINVNQPLVEIKNETKATSGSDSKKIPGKPKTKIFDLALRKYITAINGAAPATSREPVITQANLKALAEGNSSSAFDGTTTYKVHPKDALSVRTGDIVRYTIRIYNEGDVDGKATIVSDYLPAGLKLATNSEINTKYGWKADSTGKAISTDYLKNTTLKAFSKTPTNGQYIMTKAGGQIADLEIECEVIAKDNTTSLKNVAEITQETNDQNLKDIDSTAGNLTQDQKNNYNVSTSTQGKGYEDDDDFENLKLVTDVIPEGSYKLKLVKVDSTDANKKLQGAKFKVTLPGSTTATEYTTNANGEFTLPDVKITKTGTDSIKFEETAAPTGYDILQKDFEVDVEKVLSNNKYSASKATLKTATENVTISLDNNIITVTVKDKPQVFDLALRKFITKVNEQDITNRIPQVDKSNFGKVVDGKEVTTCTYNHTKEPVRVSQNDVVTYTIRIYNEGTRKGYASVIKDDIPEGLIFLPDNDTNKTYRWSMLDAQGNATTDVSKAEFITTDYLSKEQEKTAGANLLNAFNPETMASPDFKDVKVAFKVTEPNTSDRIIINKAQISEDKDENGNDVDDRDSTPDKWIEGEDDQDIEKLYVKYFDLSLRKWVTQAIVIEDGQEKVMNTGHYAEQDPEPVVKVEVNKKRLRDTVIKFRYSIRVKNEGEIEGYATELSDYIPNGLKFNQADNPKWKEVDGKITTDQLKDTLLKPGETAECEVVLTWVNSEDNMGVMTNVAEISKDKNDSNTPDIDSTPNNKKEGEDDIDDAPVALTVISGKPKTYIALITGILAAIGAGLAIVKKFVI